MGTSILAGREFDARDTLTSPKVAVVNQVFARKFFGGKNPVGRTFRLEAEAGKPEQLFQIVGLVKNTKYYELREEFMAIGFFPVAQDDDPGPYATFVLRVAGSPTELISSVKAAEAEVNATMGLQFRSFSKQLEESLLRERLMATLPGAFVILAGLLAALGLYGVIAYMVTRRRKEIGVRIALGAERHRVMLLVLREALLLLGGGLAFGVAIALLAGPVPATPVHRVLTRGPVSMMSR